MANKLTIAEKVKICRSSGKSLRVLAQEYGIHHSCIADILNESEELLNLHWQTKANRVGRPANKVGPEQVAEDNRQNRINELEHVVDLKQMRIDYLELKLKWADELFAEAKIKKSKHLKKNKKKN